MAMTLAQAQTKIGARVRYHPPGANTTARAEDGRIASVNDRYVFVIYRGSALGAKATRPEDLELLP
jgi:hypothetical protein